MEKPNIIFILTDQQRHDTCGCYGQELDITPNLDNMAEEGVKFTNCFSCQPLCGPARASLQTGLYSTQTGVFRNGIKLRPFNKTIAHYLTEIGYKVGYIGKWHLSGMKSGIVPIKYRGGYNDFWLGSNALEFTSRPYEGHVFDKDNNKVEFKGQYRVDFLTDRALDYLDNHDPNNPFFLFISYLEPHHQNEKVIGGHFQGPKGSKEKFKDFETPKDLEGLKGNWEKEIPDYLGCCHNIDENLKKIQNKLDDLNISDSTIVIFTSDHGCHFKTRNSEYKRTCHEGAVHIPLIIKGPGFEGGKEINELVGLIDLPPTILNIAGISKPSQMQGNYLQDLIAGKVEEWPEEIFIQISESHVGRAIRTKKWKYSVRAPHKIGFVHSKSKTYREDFLYDLENDPYEKNNLVESADYIDIRAKLAELLKKKMKVGGEKVPKIIPNG